MKMHDCDLCGSNRRQQIPESGGSVWVCMDCGFVYVPERRSTELVAASWSKIYGDGYTAAWPGVVARLTYVAELFEQRHGWFGKSLSEIGAGEGRFLNIAKWYGCRITHGIEPDARNCDKIEEQGHLASLGTIEEYITRPPLPQRDVVAILWTLENTADCVGMLKAARRMLDQYGTLIVATGSRICVPFKKPLSAYFGKNPPDTHCFRFSAKSLSRALALAGFNYVTFNDYHQRDELVAFARTTKHPDLVYASNDDPMEVLRHFRKWGELFP